MADRKVAWVVLGSILCVVVLTKLPAITSVIHTYPSDTARWVGPAINYANHGIEHSLLPLVDQGDYGYITGEYYYRWPLLPFYLYGLWASITSDEISAIRLAPLALHLVTTVYFFLLASLIFKKREWALAATFLFAMIPGHFYLAVQISDTQFWMTTLTGSIYHRIRHEQAGNPKHRAAHLGLVILGCFSSWFGYLTLTAHFLWGLRSDLFPDREMSVRERLSGFACRYRLTLIGVGIASFAVQVALVSILAGHGGSNRLSNRFFFWVTNMNANNADTNPISRILSIWPVLGRRLWGVHLPKVFGWPLMILFLATPLAIAAQLDRVKKMIDWTVFVRSSVAYSLCFSAYLCIFANHGSRVSHTFPYQQLSPMVALCVVLAIAVTIGRVLSGKAQLALTVACCLALVLPRFSHYYTSQDLNLSSKKVPIGSARSFGEMVKSQTLPSDFVITNAKEISGVAGRVAKLTSRRTLDYEKNEWVDVTPYLDNDAIKGLVFYHQPDAPDEFKVGPILSERLKTTATLLDETDSLLVYRLR